MNLAEFLPVFITLLGLAVLYLLIRPIFQRKPAPPGLGQDRPRHWPLPEPPKPVRVTRFDRKQTITHTDNVHSTDSDNALLTQAVLLHTVIGPGADDYGRSKPAPDVGSFSTDTSHSSASSDSGSSSDGGSCGGCD